MMLCTTVLAVLVTGVLLVLADGASLPMWKTQLIHYHDWEGHYLYQDILHECKMVVHSVQEDDNGGATVTFSADKTKLDMTVYSDDDISIVFKKEAIFEPGDHFYDDFQFVVELLHIGGIHVFLGNITYPASNFSTIRLRPHGEWGTNHVKSSDLSIGLAVGISLALFVVCVVIGIVFLRWAIRKGYLRHVAMSYKSFRNPREPAAEPPVAFNNAPQESRPEEVNVHI